MTDQQNQSLENEQWLQEPTYGYQISNLGRYISKTAKSIIRTNTRISPVKGLQLPLEYFVASLFLGYDQSQHFIELIDKNAEYPCSVDNIRLIPKYLVEEHNGVLVREEWVSVPGYVGYECSSFGRVCSSSKLHPRLLKPDTDIYLRYTLKNNNGKFKKILAHRLVICCFKKPDNFNDLVVNHIDLDKKNNKIWNLEPITYASNLAHAIELQTNALMSMKRNLTIDNINWKSDIAFSLPNGVRKTIDASGFRM